MDKLLEIIQTINNRQINIQNHIILKRYLEYTKLHGPSSVILYKLNNRLLLFFRDVHIERIKQCDDLCFVDKSNCVWISDFLKDLFINASMCIDFFCETTTWLQIQEKSIENKHNIEVNIDHEKLDKRIRGLLKTKTEFMDCLSPFKLGCSIYKTTRFHNIEFRRFAIKQYDFTGINANMFNLPIFYFFSSDINKFPKKDDFMTSIDVSKYDKKIKEWFANMSQYKYLLVALLNNNMDKVSEIINILYKNFDKYKEYQKYFSPNELISKSPYPKLWRQINTLTQDCQKFIKEYIINRYDTQILRLIKKIETSMNLANNDNQWIKKQVIDDIKLFFTDFAILILDTYAIGRMMKAIFNYDYSSLIITYAGSVHIKRYEDFFSKFASHFHLRFEKITEIGIMNDESGCIQLNNNWKTIISHLQEAFNQPSTCAIKEGIPFGEL